MTAHLSDSDRQALRLAQDLREEMRAALPQMPTAPSVSPFVDQAGMPSVLLKMDAETARALMALLAERRAERSGVPGPEPRHGDSAPVPPPAAPAVQAALAPYGEQTPPGPVYPVPEYPAPGYVDPGYTDSGYAEAPFVPQQPGPPIFPGGTGPTPLVPSVYPTH